MKREHNQLGNQLTRSVNRYVNKPRNDYESSKLILYAKGHGFVISELVIAIPAREMKNGKFGREAKFPALNEKRREMKINLPYS